MYSSISKYLIIPVFIASASSLAINGSQALESRGDKYAFAPSTLSITMFPQVNCQGNPTTVGNIVYGKDNNPYSFASYHLSRNLAKGEQLDFSTSDNGQNHQNGIDPLCDLYIKSSYADQVDPNMCQSLGNTGAGCFRLWHSS